MARIKLQEDRAILMICIGIALVFWILVKLSQVYRVWKPASLHVNVPKEMAFTKMPPNNLMLRFEARGWDLLFNSHNLSRLALYYDMQEGNELIIPDGQLRSDILENLSSPRIKVVDVNYNELIFRLEKKMVRKVPIVLVKKIEFSEGFNYSDTLSIHPDSITISGPASMVETITFWKTDSLILLNGKKNLDRSVSLFPPPRELHLSQASTMVKVPIESFTEKSFFIPVEIKNAPEHDSLSIFPSSVNVSCVVGLSKYDDLTADKIKCEVNLGITRLLEGKNTAPIVLVEYPDYVQTVKYTPKAATFFIVKKPKER